jgi:hypothetical protein
MEYCSGRGTGDGSDGVIDSVAEDVRVVGRRVGMPE